MERIWLEHYDKGVVPNIDVVDSFSLADLLEQRFRRSPDKPAYTCMGRTLSYAELDTLSQAFAAYMTQTLGLRKGDAIALMMPNILQYPITLYGAFRAGLIVVNVNPLYTARELAHQLQDSGAKAIVVTGLSAAVVEEVLSQSDGSAVSHVIVTRLGDLLSPLHGFCVNAVLKYIKKKEPAWSIDKAVSLREVLRIGRQLSFKPVSLFGDDVAFLQYTGGTTGVAKGAVLLHKQVVANAQQIKEWFSVYLKEHDETVIAALPVYHIFSLTVNVLALPMYLGGHVILVPNPRDIPGFIKLLSRHPFSVFAGVNTLFAALLNYNKFSTLDFSSLKVTLGGGAAVQQVTAEHWQKITGRPIIQGYGLTEASPVVSANPLTSGRYHPSIGLPLPSTDISIRNEKGVELAIGEVGELWVKGPQVMQGYWQRDDETKKVLSEDGWLRTGDMGQVDETGRITLVGRQKEMILVSGFNVYPDEVEDVVVQCEGVLEAAAVGVPSQKSGEAVKIVVVKKQEAVTEDEIIDHCRSNLAGYKVPSVVEFRESLPKSPIGKVLRREL